MLFVVLAAAQPAAPEQLDQVTSKEFLQQLVKDGVYNFISPGVAQSLVIHRVEPTVLHGNMVGRVSGTVIVAFELTRDGRVRHAMAVSGPRLLQGPVLAAVKQWTFKPYMLNGEPITVATSIQLAVKNF